MSKFNASVEGSMKTENHEGHTAYSMNDRDKLVTQVLTSFFNEEKFYGDNSTELVETLKKVIKNDPQFVSNLAIFARREFNMRSVSHVLAGYLANINEGKPFVKRTVKEIVLRGDDATEILSFYLNTFGKPIPNSLRKAIREVFTGFDAYTLAKYKGEGHAVKMRDILCLCRPAPKDSAQSETWKKLLEGTLEPAYTWETKLSAKGNNKETWEELIDSGKVGYMALLRNLRNILNADPNNIQKVFDKLSDKKEVLHSKQLPFRFLSAYRNLPADSWNSREARDILEKAAEIAVENLPKIPGRTIIAIDTSGSMSGVISSKSDIRCCDISILLGIIADKICEQSRVFTFDTRLRELQYSKRDGILSTAISYSNCGGGTNMYLPFQYILNDKIKADRVIIISDNECNYQCTANKNSYYWGYNLVSYSTVQNLVSEYRRTMNPDLWVHGIDLQGYGTQQFVGEKFNLISGWSEKVFEFIDLAEQGVGTLRKRIENYMVHD